VGTEDPKLVNQKLEAEIANLRAETAKTAGEPPTLPEVKVPEGTVDVSSTNGLVGRLLAHQMLRAEGQEIVRLIEAHEWQRSQKGERSRDALRVLLVSSPDLISDDLTYWTVRTGIDRERTQVDRCLSRLSDFLARRARTEERAEEAGGDLTVIAGSITSERSLSFLIGPGGPAVSTAVTAATTLVGMLRTDYKVSGSDVGLGQQALLAAVAGKILAAKWEVIIDGFDLLPDGAVMIGFAALCNRGKLLEAEVESLPRQSLAEDETRPGDIPPPLRALLQEADAALKRLGEFVAGVTTAPTGGGHPSLIEAARAGLLHAEGDEAIDYAVYAGVEGGGQEVITKRGFNPFANRRVFYLGGAAGHHYIYDVKQRRTAAAGTIPLLAKVRFNLHSGEIEGAPESIKL
jgi:hypothetical protein